MEQGGLLIQDDWCPDKKRERRRPGRWPCGDGGRDWSDPEDARSYQKLERARKGAVAHVPCRHLEFRPLAPRTERQYVLVVLSRPVCGASL